MFSVYDFESWLTRKLLYVRVDTMSIRVAKGPEGGPRSSRKQIRSMLDEMRDDETRSSFVYSRLFPLFCHAPLCAA